MATDEDPEAPGSRLTLLIGLVVAGLASTAAFGRVYKGTDVTIRLCLISLAATALAALMVRRSVLLATAASAAALLVAIGLLVFPETTRYALPTLSTLRAIGASLRHVGEDANLTVAPAPPVASLMLAGVTAVWTAAFAAHSLAFRARSPLLALTPLAALLAFAGVVLEDGARPLYVLVFVLGALIVLFGDAVRRLGLWGPISAWRGRRGFAARSRTSARGAWRVAAGTLGIALFLPWLLPGFGAGSILRPRSGIAPRVLGEPDRRHPTAADQQPGRRRVHGQDEPPDLLAHEHPGHVRRDDVARVRRSAPERGLDPGARRDPDPRHRLPEPRDADGPRSRHATHPVRGTHQPSMPIAGTPLAVEISDGSLRVRSGLRHRSLSVRVLEARGRADRDLRRRRADAGRAERGDVVGLPGRPLHPAPARAGDAADPRHRAHRSPPAGSRPTRRSWRSSSASRAGRYDVHVPPSTSDDALLRFLQTTNRGYCQQFAGAMAVLLRALGYPARVAVGFTSGTYDAALPALPGDARRRARVGRGPVPRLRVADVRPDPHPRQPGGRRSTTSRRRSSGRTSRAASRRRRAAAAAADRGVVLRAEVRRISSDSRPVPHGGGPSGRRAAIRVDPDRGDRRGGRAARRVDR